LPSSDKTSQRDWLALGRGERVTSKNTSDNTPAMAQHAQVTNQGESCGASSVPVANRVIGKVRANTVTPNKPRPVPIHHGWDSVESVDFMALNVALNNDTVTTQLNPTANKLYGHHHWYGPPC